MLNFDLIFFPIKSYCLFILDLKQKLPNFGNFKSVFYQEKNYKYFQCFVDCFQTQDDCNKNNFCILKFSTKLETQKSKWMSTFYSVTFVRILKNILANCHHLSKKAEKFTIRNWIEFSNWKKKESKNQAEVE